MWPAQVAGVDLLGDRVRVRLNGAPTLSGETGTASAQSLAAMSITRIGVEHMELSARNQLKGTVKAVKSGAVMAEITVDVSPDP